MVYGVGLWGCLGDDDGGGNVVFGLELVAREEVLFSGFWFITTYGEVSRGEKMLETGADPESYITEYTLAYEDDTTC